MLTNSATSLALPLSDSLCTLLLSLSLGSFSDGIVSSSRRLFGSEQYRMSVSTVGVGRSLLRYRRLCQIELSHADVGKLFTLNPHWR